MNGIVQPRPTALIAEDDDIDRLLLAEATELAGFSVTAVADGAAALAKAQAQHFDIGLFDVEMPGLNGYELCRQVRRILQLVHLPIVMITGRDDAASIEAAYEAGATDFVSKPLNWTLVPYRLRYILRNADAEKRIRELAYVDSVTGWPNRARFLEQLHGALTPAASAVNANANAGTHAGASAQADGGSLAVLSLEVDGFTRIAETFGLGVANQAMRAFASRLQACLPAGVNSLGGLHAARFERGHFALCVHGPRARQDVEALAARIASGCSELVDCGEHRFFLRPDMGIALSPEHSDRAAELLMYADSAKHQAKVSGADAAVVYAEEIGTKARARLTLDGELRRAVRDQQLRLHFQPKVRVSDGGLTGVEALLRWHHPDLGEIPPRDFIPLAEESGLILELGDWVIRAACKQLRQWRDEGFETTIAVNVASPQFMHGNPSRTIREAAADAGVEPARLLVEITESVLASDLTGVRAGLEAVRALGCRVAVDDFGTGYSSLAYLKELPIDELKIDQAFLRLVDVEATNAAIYAAIINLARQLRLSITAEGVETAGQLAWLRAQGCDEAQGYLIARPMPQWELRRRFGPPRDKQLVNPQQVNQAS